MKIVFLDSAIINPGDISWEGLQRFGELEVRKRTSREEAVSTIGDAEAVFTDSFAIDRELMEACPSLKFIGISATGFNHVDLDAAKELGIAVANVPAHSREKGSRYPAGTVLPDCRLPDRCDKHTPVRCHSRFPPPDWLRCRCIGSSFLHPDRLDPEKQFHSDAAEIPAHRSGCQRRTSPNPARRREMPIGSCTGKFCFYPYMSTALQRNDTKLINIIVSDLKDIL